MDCQASKPNAPSPLIWSVPCCILLSCLGLQTAAAATAHSQQSIHEILDTYCLNCHDSDSMKGGVDLDYDPDGKNPIAKEPLIWQRVVEVLEMGAMPPPDKKQLPAGQKKALHDWIAKGLDKEIKRTSGDPGDVPLRRLSKAEVKNIIYDLTKLKDLQSIEDLPPDPAAGEGFANVASVLQLNSDHLDAFINTAHAIADRAAYYQGSGLVFHPDPTTEDSLVKIQQHITSRADLLLDPILPKLVLEEALDRVAYAQASWRYRESPELQKAGIPALAKKLKLDPDYLANWWELIGSVLPDESSPNIVIQTMHRRWQAIPSAQAGSVTAQSPIPSEVDKAIKRFIKDVTTVSDNGRTQSVKIGIVNNRANYGASIDPRVGKLTSFYVVTRDLGDGLNPDLVFADKITYSAPAKDPKTNKMRSRRHEYMGWIRKYIAEHKSSGSFPDELKHLADMESRFKGKRLEMTAHEILRLPVPPGATTIQMRFGAGTKSSKDFSIQAALLDHDPGDAHYVLGPMMKVRWDNQKMLKPKFARKWTGYIYKVRNLFPSKKEYRQVQFQRIWRNIDTEKASSTEVLNFKQASARMPAEMVSELKRYATDWREVTYRISLKKIHEYQTSKKDDPKAQSEITRLTEVREKMLAKIGDHRAGLKDAILRFAEQAWARQLTQEEQQHLSKSIVKWDAHNKDPHHDLRQGIAEVLTSPHFIMRRLASAPSKDSHATLTDVALSQRLAAMLWVSNPDDQLRALAANNELHKPEVLQAEIKRMIQAPKINAFNYEFFGTWLQFKGFRDFNTVDRLRFPEFTDDIKLRMEQEAAQFCLDLIKKDRAITDLISSSNTMLDTTLAKYYGMRIKYLPGGPRMKSTEVKKFQRGGLLGMGFFHAKTSYALRTSPVLRGEYVMARLLGRHMPPPPPGVPALPEDDSKSKKSMAEHLRQHREDPRCGACHDHIDPLGIPLEAFSPSGRLRKEDGGGRPLSVKADMRGETIAGQQGLRQYLIKHQDEFVTLFCRKLIAYGLGRPIQIGDKPLIEQMVKELKAKKFSFSAAVTCLVNSRQFRYRRTS